MGLDPALLGTPYEVTQPKTSADRCPSTNEDGDQCARRAGHDGIHARGYSRWDEDEVPVKLVEDAEPFTVPEGFTVSIPKINVKEVEDVGPQEDPDAG
jgi:hypothetical protein